MTDDRTADDAAGRDRAGGRSRSGATRGERPARTWVRRSLQVVLLAVLVLGVWGGWQAAVLAREARTGQERLAAARAALADRDLDLAHARAEEAADHLARADAAAAAVPFRVLSLVPVVGDDVRGVRTLASASHAAAADVVVPALGAARTFLAAQQQAPDGSVDLVALRDAGGAVSDAAAASARVRADVERIDASAMVPPLQTRTDDAVAALVGLDDQVQRADGLLAVLPGALGADGPRSYLLAAQNLAEARPTGGIMGSWALLSVDGGTVSLLETGANDDLESLRGRLPELPPEVLALYGQDLALSPNVNLVPDFPIAAGLLSEVWTAQGRPLPDGVVGVDVVALARVLGATGGVEVPGGPPLTRDNLVQVVQADAYRTFADDDAARRAYLSAVMATVFDSLLRADWGDPAVGQAVGRSLADRHVQLWAADERVQDALEGVGAAGHLPQADDGTSDVRLHLTNLDGSKLDQYLRLSVSTRCDDAPVVEVALAYAPPPNVPPYATNKLEGQDPRSHRVTVSLLLPPVRGLDGLEVDGTTQEVAVGALSGWQVVRATVDLVPDSRTVMTYRLTGDDVVPSVQVQPLVRPLEPGADAAGRTCG